jgi:chaperone modulatory protein CbpM
MTTYALARPLRLDLDAFARMAGLHPDVVRRFVALGLVVDLLDRIARLEAAQRRHPSTTVSTGARQWT